MKTFVLLSCLVFTFSTINAQGFDEKTETKLKTDFVNVVNLVKNLIQKGKITVDNSKAGVDDVFSNGGQYPVNFRFQGIIEPAVTGIVKFNNIYFDPIRGFAESEKDKITDPINIEYVISNDSVKSIRFIDPQKQLFDIQYFILIKDKNLKIIREKKGQGYSDANKRNYFIEHYSLADKVLELMSYLPISLEGKAWYDLFSSLFKPVYRSVISGNLISSNIDLGMYGNEGVINAQNENCILTRKSWTTFQDLKNNLLQYHEVDLKENDTVFVFSSLINVDKKRFKYESFIDKTVKTEYWYNSGGDIIAMVDKQQLLTLFDNNNYKSKPKPTRYNPLVFSIVKDTLTNFVVTKVMMDNKILAEGNVKYDLYYSSISGQFKTYSVKANIGDGIEAKIALTCQQPLQEYIRSTTLKNWASPAVFKPNQFYTNEFAKAIFRSLYIDPSPLSITPLGKFDPKSQKFIDPSPDYLYQKIEFADIKDEKGTVLTAYQYLPDGKVFDSINRKLNDFGEQIGKSKFKDYPKSKEYVTAFNKKMEESVDDGSFNILYNEKRSKEIANYCSYCGKPFTKGQQGILSKMEFPCGNRTVVSDVIYKFCSFKCYDEYRKSVCETNR
jgi:hypothetical protein